MATRKSKAADAASVEAATPSVSAIKGFDANWRCRGYQFAVGRTYEHVGKVKACSSGFHACPDDHHPLSVFSFYPPAGARYAAVTVAGETNREDTKIAAAKITINVELSIGDLVNRAWDYVWTRAKIEGAASATGEQGAASATGYQGAASATNGSAAFSTGYMGKVMGEEDGCPLGCAERTDYPEYKLLSFASGITGRDGIKAGVWYRCKSGKLVEVI